MSSLNMTESTMAITISGLTIITPRGKTMMPDNIPNNILGKISSTASRVIML